MVSHRKEIVMIENITNEPIANAHDLSRLCFCETNSRLLNSQLLS